MIWLGVICVLLCVIILVQIVMHVGTTAEYREEREALTRLVVRQTMGNSAVHAYEGTDEPKPTVNEPVG